MVLLFGRQPVCGYVHKRSSVHLRDLNENRRGLAYCQDDAHVRQLVSRQGVLVYYSLVAIPKSREVIVACNGDKFFFGL
jgi:hypothetical protein